MGLENKSLLQTQWHRYTNSGDKCFYPTGRKKISSHGRFSSHFQGEKKCSQTVFNIIFFPISCFSSALVQNSHMPLRHIWKTASAGPQQLWNRSVAFPSTFNLGGPTPDAAPPWGFSHRDPASQPMEHTCWMREPKWTRLLYWAQHILYSLLKLWVFSVGWMAEKGWESGGGDERRNLYNSFQLLFWGKWIFFMSFFN